MVERPEDDGVVTEPGLAEVSHGYTRAVPAAGSAAVPSFVVGIGASAGGLRPIQNFVTALPRQTGCAFIIVQHLSPDFASMMDELLERCTDIPIRHVEDGQALEADTIYLNPPRATLTVENGRLHVTVDPAPRGQSPRVIDALFASLGETYGDKAAAIILSGTGSDGTQGAEQIRVNKGLVMAQAPDTAEFDFMPRHVIDAGIARKIDTAEGLAAALQRWIHGEREGEIGRADTSIIQDILGLLESNYGIDFKDYKTDTIHRRIGRRALLMPHLRFADYCEMLQHNAQELERLYHDLLINVTGFFRNPDAFDHLANLAIPKLIEGAASGDTLRAWVPGCATGEEAYSLAILFAEALHDSGKDLEFSIFATDIHRPSLVEASRGFYSAERLEGVSTARTERFFHAESDGFRIDQDLRRRVTFSHLNVLEDPPFTRMDLVSCRNVLIYFTQDAQRHVLQRLHFGLNVGGILFLGSSETTGLLDPEFESLNQRWNIYSKKRDTRFGRLYERAGLRPKTKPASAGAKLVRAIAPESKLTLGYEALLGALVPAGVLTDEDGRPLHLFGDAGHLLRWTSGAFERPITEFIQDHLRSAVNTAMQRARLHREAVTVLSQPHPDDGKITACRVVPLSGMAEHNYMLCTFTDHAERREVPLQAVPAEDDGIAERRITELERDLQVTEESLQSTIEQLQVSNEELMASNEELQSSNEELHSVNEELHTLGQENRERIRELTALTNDMDSLLAAIDVPVVFVDDEMKIRRFTAAATDLFHVTDADHHRVLTAVRPRFDDRALLDEMRRMQAGETPEEREVISESGRIYLLRLRRMQSKLPSVSGTLIVFFDITERERQERDTRARTIREREVAAMATERDRLLDLFRQTPAIIGVCEGAEHRFVFCNPALTRLVGRELEGHALRDALPEIEGQGIFEKYDRAYQTGRPVIDLELPVSFKRSADGAPELGYFTSVMQPYRDPDGAVAGVMLFATDITAQVKTRTEIEKLFGELETVYRGAPVGLCLFDRELRYEQINERLAELNRCSVEGHLGRTVREVIPEIAETIEPVLRQVLDSGKAIEDLAIRVPVPSYDDQLRDFTVSYLPVFAGGDPLPVGVNAVVTDMTDTKRMRAMATANEALERFTYIAAHDLRAPLRGIRTLLSYVREDAALSASDETLQYIDLAVARTGRMQALTDDILAFSKIDRQQLQLEDMTVDGVVSQALAMLELPEHFTVHKSAQSLSFKVPRVLLTMVLRNLIDNAIKHHDRDHGQVWIDCAVLDDDWLRFTVCDDGPGVPPEHREAMFGMFQRLRPKDEIEGSGLGLSYVKKVVEQMDGTIRLDAPEDGGGRGCRITFTWPYRLEGIVS